MGQKVSFLRLDREIFSTKSSIPFEFGANIPKVRQLNCLCNFRVNNNGSESNSILHKFHFYTMSSSKNVEQFFLFLILDYFVAQLSLEGIDSSSGLEAYLYINLFSWINCYWIAWYYLNKLFFQFFKLIINIKSDFYLLLRTTDQTNNS